MTVPQITEVVIIVIVIYVAVRFSRKRGQSDLLSKASHPKFV
jgi:hypothetical protein